MQTNDNANALKKRKFSLRLINV